MQLLDSLRDKAIASPWMHVCYQPKTLAAVDIVTHYRCSQVNNTNCCIIIDKL